jgi:alpha-tubulin suppressor-like RCC1 family protein
LGQVGDGTVGKNILFPVSVNNLGALLGKVIIQIQSSHHNCILANDSNLYYWGWNS